MSLRLQSLPSLQRYELTVMLITGLCSSGLWDRLLKVLLEFQGGKHRLSLSGNFSVLRISLRTFSWHQAILTNAFENHHGLTRVSIQMILGMAHPPPIPPSDTHAPTLKVRSSRGTLKNLPPPQNCILYPRPLKATQLPPHSCCTRLWAFSENCQSTNALSFQTGHRQSDDSHSELHMLCPH